jgi:hypothetical protein
MIPQDVPERNERKAIEISLSFRSYHRKFRIPAKCDDSGFECRILSFLVPVDFGHLERSFCVHFVPYYRTRSLLFLTGPGITAQKCLAVPPEDEVVGDFPLACLVGDERFCDQPSE